VGAVSPFPISPTILEQEIRVRIPPAKASLRELSPGPATRLGRVLRASGAPLAGPYEEELGGSRKGDCGRDPPHF